ncbi:vWA domain-containing protein [Kangiella marina]|uniref:VWFA domain-containing protein n=1 Tax=Kangiella marina TaxID=1079178 RepID=A0ABP8IEY6_9GAMM
MPDLSLFHFIRPWALLLIVPAIILYWLYQNQSTQQEGWSAIIDQHLLDWIMPRSDKARALKYLPIMLLSFWIIASVALAGPTWKKTPQPVFSSKATQVILLDLSLSMDADDIKPSRLERAKFKIKDYLKLHHEGLTGLVVYAGEGFILSPLTSDKDTIENLLGALSTKIMPVLGSRPESGFELAIDLLDNTGLAQGKILWFTDGADQESLDDITEQLDDTPYQLNILAIGSEDGAPIKLSDEEGFLKDRNGNIVIPQIDYSLLTQFAQNTDALLTPVTVDNQDVQLMAQASSIPTTGTDQENKFADDWFDLGYWLILLLLPIALLSFKHRNLLGCLCFVTFASIVSTPIHAASEAKPKVEAEIGTVEKLFLNKDQQGKKLLDKKSPAKAYSTFEDQRWKAVSAYRMGSFDTAQNLFNKLPTETLTADDYYNKANSLALNGDYEQAIDTYNKALEINPSHADAEYNKSIIEQMKQQQDQQNDNGQNQEQESEQQNQDQQSQQQNQQNSEQDSEQESSEQNEQAQEQQEQEQQRLTPEQLEEQFKEDEKDQEMEQWLKRLSDDPGGLLRRKMYREYQRRGHKQHVEENW